MDDCLILLMLSSFFLASPPLPRLVQDYMEGCGDSLDLVPIAAWHGKGKRKGAYGESSNHRRSRRCHRACEYFHPDGKRRSASVRRLPAALVLFWRKTTSFCGRRC